MVGSYVDPYHDGPETKRTTFAARDGRTDYVVSVGNLYDPGDVLCSRFEIERFLGRGAVGEGYKAKDKLLAETVVCKVAIGTEARDTREFHEQYRKLRTLTSNGLVRVLGIQEHQARVFIVMEWIDGIDLSDWCSGQPLRARLDALAQVSSALEALHAVGGTHGDLWGGVNVVAGSARGCVLIDPQPEIWGTTSGSSERRSDRESLAQLVEQLVPEYSSKRLAPLVSGLRAPPPAGIPIDVAASQIRGVARNAPAIPGDAGAIAAAGASYVASVRALNGTYKANRLHRQLSIEELSRRISDVAVQFGLTVKHTPANESVEAGRDQAGMGHFLEREIECVASLGGRFSIVFEEVEDFYKPWPYGGGGLALGEWRVGAKHGQIELLMIDGAPSFNVADAVKRNVLDTVTPDPEPQFRPLDDDWILARVADLTGVSVTR